MKLILRVLVPLLVLLLAGIAAAVLWSGLRSLDAPVALPAPARFIVPPGGKFRACGGGLEGARNHRATQGLGAVCALQGPRLRGQGGGIRD